MTSFSEDCSLKIPCALSPSFQKSGREVAWVSSSTRFFFPSRSKTPPQKLESFFQMGQLFGGLFQHFVISFRSLFSAFIILGLGAGHKARDRPSSLIVP
jgi:hypothetical protein